jgi:hypothetical protein
MTLGAILAILTGAGAGAGVLGKYLPKVFEGQQKTPNNFEEIKEEVQNTPSPTPTPTPISPPIPTPTPANPTFQDVLQYTFDQSLRKNFHPAPVMSQAAAESQRMNSNFAKTRNNLMGMGSFDNNLDNTWKFEHPLHSIDAYFNLIENDKRYKEAYENRHNPLRYIEEVKKAGYASDPNYVNMISNTPEWRMGVEATQSGKLNF